MANVLFSHPTDNVAAAVTPVLTSGAADPDYPVANAIDLNPALPMKLTTTSGTLQWTFSEPQSIAIAAIIHHNFDEALDVRVQATDDEDWNNLDLNAPLVIPAWTEDNMPVNPFVDLTSGAHSFRFWRIVFPVNSAAIRLGDIMLLSQKRQLPINIEWGLVESELRPIIEHQTDYLVTSTYSYNVAKRVIRGTLDTTDAGANSLKAWWRACYGRALPFLFALDPDINDCMMARFVNNTLDITREFLDCNKAPLHIEEVVRGLAL